jgi:hypothetical protein
MVRRNSIGTASELKKLFEGVQDVLKEAVCLVVQGTREPEMDAQKLKMELLMGR